MNSFIEPDVFADDERPEVDPADYPDDDPKLRADVETMLILAHQRDAHVELTGSPIVKRAVKAWVAEWRGTYEEQRNKLWPRLDAIGHVMNAEGLIVATVYWNKAVTK